MTSAELTQLLDLYAREKAEADATGVVNGHWVAIEAVADAVRQADVSRVERVEREAVEAEGSACADLIALRPGGLAALRIGDQLVGIRACLAALKDGVKKAP